MVNVPPHTRRRRLWMVGHMYLIEQTGGKKWNFVDDKLQTYISSPGT